MTLSNKRKAIVEEFEKRIYGKANDLIVGQGWEEHEQWLTQALNNYTQSIIEMVKYSKIWVQMPEHNLIDRDELLEELQK